MPLRHICRVTFRRSKEREGRYLSAGNLPGGEVRVIILFKGSEYPFEKHYRYARHRSPEAPYTFSQMEFSADPPGLRVGPWPGWRGIPEFPRANVRSGEQSARVALMPWGDELQERHIRGVASLHIAPGGILECESGDPGLIPAYADLYEGGPPRADPIPVSLVPGLASSHPRLLVTREEIGALKEKAEGADRAAWNRILQLLEERGLPWEITPESKILPGPERTGRQDRSFLTAFAALVDPAPGRLKAARESFLAYLEETQQPAYEPLGIDTQAGETLFVLSVCYDWLYGLWTDVERNEISDWIRHVAEVCWAYLGYERRDYGQAHYLGCGLGLLAFSFLFWDEHPRAREWAAHCRGVLGAVIPMIPADGFYPHGINLWIYEYGFLLRWLELFRVCTGTDLWHPAERWRNSSAFRGAATSPDGLYGATFGDPQYRVGGDSWCHQLIAARTRSPRAQWLGERLREITPEGVDFRSAPPRRRVYEFLYHDSSVAPERPVERISEFRDGGQVFVRGKGEQEALFTFRAGSPLGKERYRAGEAGGYGHADPANGSFLLFLAGGPALRGPGPTYRRDTSLHNTITVDGRGQIGDSTVWIPDFIPPEVICPDARFEVRGEGVSVRAELAPAYLPYLQVEECLRSLWVDPERFILGVDSVRCKESRTIDWHMHAPAFRPSTGSCWTIAGGAAGPRDLCRIMVLDPPDARAETGLTDMVPAYPNDGERFARLRVQVRGRDANFVWCILLDRSLGNPRLKRERESLSIGFDGGPTITYKDGYLTPAHDEHRT